MRDDDEGPEAPPTIVGAAAAGVAPLPFLAVYAVLFISHGTFHPVVPPDITSSKTGELLAGLIAAALLVAVIVGVVFLMSGRRRWPYATLQAATLVTSVDFIIDRTTGSPLVPIVLAITSLVGLVLVFSPAADDYLQRPSVARLVARTRSKVDTSA